MGQAMLNEFLMTTYNANMQAYTGDLLMGIKYPLMISTTLEMSYKGK